MMDLSLTAIYLHYHHIPQRILRTYATSNVLVIGDPKFDQLYTPLDLQL